MGGEWRCGGGETYSEASAAVKLEKCVCKSSHDIEDNSEG